MSGDFDRLPAAGMAKGEASRKLGTRLRCFNEARLFRFGELTMKPWTVMLCSIMPVLAA